MENAIAETLFAIEEGDECIAVIVGDVGLGKTMSIRMMIDALDQDKYKIALITNPGISFVQILQEIIGQLTGKQCEEKRKVDLLEIFNRLLFSTLEEGRKILIFIDEANAITPMNLENLRLLTNMQGDKRNLFTMVLAGQIEFARRLEHPKRANLFQRVGTYSRIDKLESVDKVRKYVETRVALAGATKRIFADDAFDILWEQSDHGVPRLVNKLSKLCLKAGETNHFEWITGEIVGQISSRFHKLTGPAIQKRKSRRCIPTEVQSGGNPKAEGNEAADVTHPEEEWSGRIENEQTAFITQQTLPQEERNAEGEASDPAAKDAMSFTPPQQSHEEPEHAKRDSEAEMCIGHVRIKINFPEHLMKQSLSSSQEYRFKLAGGIAAETLRKYPHLVTSHSTDPVPIWLEIRDFVLNRITHTSRM
ncbi:MAG: AAA family ATPase [Deltaproteobacteria bacterium]|nr:AAA family ATPase [Deltaproteobacteria bacterium]